MAPNGALEEPMLFFFLFIFITACSAALQLHALRVPDDRSWRRLGHVGTLRNVLFCLSWARLPRGSFQAAWERVDRTYGVKIPIYAPLLEVIVILSYGILFVLFVLDLLATMPARLIITAIRNLREKPSARPTYQTRVLESLPRTFAYLVYIRWVVLSRSEWENLRHAKIFPDLLGDLFGQLPRGSMQIGIAGYCVMLFFDFILRFREEVRPFMPILRVFIVCASFFFQIRLLFQLWRYWRITQAAIMKVQELQRLHMMQQIPIPNG